MHGCLQGGRACVVAPGGACVVAPGGGVHGCSGGACVVAQGGMHGCSGGGGVSGFFHEIRSMSGRYASYWNAFLFNQNVYAILIWIFQCSVHTYVKQAILHPLKFSSKSAFC